MRERGYTLAGGLGELAERVIRVGHMGDLDRSHLERMLGELAGLAV
jgi:aspartate aminotransferase-like enzyme